MKKDIRFFIKLFLATFYLSAFTIGGGYVMIPLMRKKFVEEFHWIEGDEMLDLVAIAQSAPGAIAINAAIIIGYRLAGLFGAIVTVAGAVMPPLIILSAVSIAYTIFRDSATVQFVLRGMQAGVAAIILDVVISLISEAIKEKRVLPFIIMLCAFVAAFIFRINVIFVILASGVAGVLVKKHWKLEKRGKKL